MKKDKLWAKIKIHEELDGWRNIEGGIDEDGVNYVLNIIDQINEPEVLSQKWLEEHRKSYTMEDSVEISDLQNLLVPKQELPVMPKYVAEYLDFAKKEASLIEVLVIVSVGWPTMKKEFSWILANDETFARAWLDGYTVEKEQKYIIKIGNLYLAEPLGDMTSDIVRMTRDKEVAYQFTDEKSIATHLDKFEGTEAVKVEELEK